MIPFIPNVTASLNAATSSYETKGRSIVSGSSQIDVMSTTNIARLVTTGSNQFNGNQIITGSLNVGGTGSYNGMTISSHTNNVGGAIYGKSLTTASVYVDNTNMVLNGETNTYLRTANTDRVTINSTGVTVAGNILPEANGTRDLGSAAARWSTVYTSDLSLNNGIGDWTIVEGEDDLFLYNNKKGKVYKFALTEVDPNVATPKKS